MPESLLDQAQVDAVFEEVGGVGVAQGVDVSALVDATLLSSRKPLQGLPPQLWRKDWVVHLQHAGSGEKVLEYLARYVFRIALDNSRLERFENGQVTFRFPPARLAPGTLQGPPLRPVQPLPETAPRSGPRATRRLVRDPLSSGRRCT